MNLYNKIIIGILLAILVIGCGTTPDFSDRIPTVEKSQFIKHDEDWRNLRYGEVIPVFRKGAKLYVEIYNTVQSNELPQELWEKLDATAMAKEYGAEKVILNGPRFWLVNKLEGRGETSKGKLANFGGIEMTKRATIEVSVLSGTVGDKTYKDNEIKRETTFYFYKDNMVYELTSPKGEVYRMQSYAQFIDRTLTIEQLENLGERLDLPEGWSYKAKILKQNSTMVADGIAYVINDELGNSYQKITQ